MTSTCNDNFTVHWNILDLDHDLGLHACIGYFKNERISTPPPPQQKSKRLHQNIWFFDLI